MILLIEPKANMKKPVVSLLVGGVPTCDRCCEKDAKVCLNLPTLGNRTLCEDCLGFLIECGFHINKTYAFLGENNAPCRKAE